MERRSLTCQGFHTSLLAVLTVLSVAVVHIQSEMLTNPSFESGITGWIHDGFNMQTDSTHVHSGLVSVKCTGRTHRYHGPAQLVHVTPGTRYSFSAYIWIANQIPNTIYEKAYVKIRFTWKDDGSFEYFFVTAQRFLRQGLGWIKLGADFKVPNREYTEARLYVEGLSVGIEYYFDDASLTEIPEITKWKEEANARIEQLRKSNLHIDFNVGSNFDAKDIIVQLDHRKHLFGFGSMVRGDSIIDSGYQQYRDVITYMFNWATLQDYKWRYNRGTPSNPDYNMAVAATDVLRGLGLQVRGHCMFWAVEKNVPNYVPKLNATSVAKTVENHIFYMTNITRGKLGHWDVNNELLHGHFFEMKTENQDFTKHMFQAVHAQDPVPKLFLNDYNVVANGQSTVQYLGQILDFKAANVSLGGVGVQSHFPDFTAPDMTLMKYRLDLLGTANVPLWVTEMDLSSKNQSEKADWYENALRMYFSHPAVDGVVFWGFWDHDTNTLKALVHGYTYALDKAGERYLNLTKEEWSTHVNISLASGTSIDVRGFQGEYEMTVWHKGKPIKNRNLFLGKADKRITVNISGDGHEITLPDNVNPFSADYVAPDPGLDHETDSEHLHALGQAASQSNSQQLTCTSRWSRLSAIGDDKFVDVSCNSDEILTGCSSKIRNDGWQRDGEKIIMRSGKPVCRAQDGFQSEAGVQAIARCCSLQSLACTYISAGPSRVGIDDQSLVPCAAQTYPLGCSTFTYSAHSDGTFFTNKSCIAQNDGSQSGVYAYAVCCKGNHLTCTTVYSATSSLERGDKAFAKCPSGQVMTGCNVFSKYGRAAGAFVGSGQDGTDTCIAVNGFTKYGEEVGVQAIATCCHL